MPMYPRYEAVAGTKFFYLESLEGKVTIMTIGGGIVNVPVEDLVDFVYEVYSGREGEYKSNDENIADCGCTGSVSCCRCDGESG